MRARLPALAPFDTRSFRYQWPADLCTAWALEMETLILGWYVLVETGSVVQLTLFGALMYVGTLLSPLLGTLADRVGLRQVLAGMRASYALLAAAILALVATGNLSPSSVLVVAFLVGLIKPSDIGMRAALVSAIVPLLVACVAWYLSLLGLAFSTGPTMAMALYVAAGLNQSLGMVALSILLLRTSHERFRGRVMGVRMLAIYTLPLGLLASGPLVAVIGFRGLVLLYVGLGLTLVASIARVWRRDLLPQSAPANALG